MSIDLSNYNKRTLSDEERRALAVSAVLSLILAKAGNSPDKTTTLSSELDNLSVYADKIQEALKIGTD